MHKVEKIEIAKELLESALYHYYETSSYFTAMHCAGAAEEILGSYVELYGGKTSHQSNIYSFCRTTKAITGEMPKKKDASKFLNFPKNTIKHMDDNNDTTVSGNPKVSARTLLERAMENYDLLIEHIELEEIEGLSKFRLELVGITR